MSPCILLDPGLLGLIVNPNGSEEATQATNWLEGQLAAGASIYIPEISDYQVRRELMRAGKAAALQRLGLLHQVFGYIPITTVAIREAAALWVELHEGRAAPGSGLDGDTLLAAQALVFRRYEVPDGGVVIATRSQTALGSLTAARPWQEIA